MKKLKVLILASIMTLSLCATVFATEVNTQNGNNETPTTQSTTDPHPW